MINTDIKEPQNELDEWLKMLDEKQQENIAFKYDLIHVLKQSMNRQVLEEAEHFQTIFINKDIMIALLRDKIAVQQKLSVYAAPSQRATSRLSIMRDKIRQDMGGLEKDFNLLKALFSEYLAARC